MSKKKESQSGKGDSPRNCQSQKYRNNYDDIKWNKNASVQKCRSRHS